MKLTALATDYDGTIACDGVVDAATCESLRRIRRAGTRTILVTGRRLDSLERASAPVALFDRIVAENGAILHDPATGSLRSIAPPADARLVEALVARNVQPLNVGGSIVATCVPMDAIVRDVIADLGLDVRIVYNKGAVMVLPGSIDKAVGLAAALEDLGLQLSDVAGIGDAENDIPFLRACGLSAAVANALPAIRAIADVRLAGDHGRGVVELIERLWPEHVVEAPGAALRPRQNPA